MTDTPTTCPHCGARLVKWRIPDGSNWVEDHFLACFDDECSYYQKGWEWMEQQFGHRVSYRFAVSPVTGAVTNIPVWSDSATRELVVDETDKGETDE